jgi:small multidrug resistance family-3 protein
VIAGSSSSSSSLSVSLFLLAVLLEILGGWLVWQFCREKKPIWYLLLGCVVLI